MFDDLFSQTGTGSSSSAPSNNSNNSMFSDLFKPDPRLQAAKQQEQQALTQELNKVNPASLSKPKQLQTALSKGQITRDQFLQRFADIGEGATKLTSGYTAKNIAGGIGEAVKSLTYDVPKGLVQGGMYGLLGNKLLQGQQQESAVESENIQRISDLQKQGKITPEAARRTIFGLGSEAGQPNITNNKGTHRVVTPASQEVASATNPRNIVASGANTLSYLLMPELKGLPAATRLIEGTALGGAGGFLGGLGGEKPNYASAAKQGLIQAGTMGLFGLGSKGRLSPSLEEKMTGAGQAPATAPSVPPAAVSNEARLRSVAEEYFKDKPQATADYQAHTMNEFKVDKPNVVSADSAKFIVDKDMTPEKSAPFHDSASGFSKDYYKTLLADQTTKDQPVMFTAGGSGAGKTTALTNLEGGKLNDYAAIVDTNMADTKSAVTKIDQALDSGRQVHINYVYRDPVESYVNGVLPRAESTGRTVPTDVHVGTHVGSLDTIQQVAEHYKDNPDVTIRVIDNSGPRGTQPVIKPLDFLKDKVYNKDELHERIHNELNQAYNQGKISPETYHASRTPGESPSPVTSPSLAQGNQAPSATAVPATTPTTESGVTLNAGVNPGIDQLIKQDIVPKAQAAATGAGKAAKEIQGVVAPSTVDENALQTSLAVRKYQSGSANEAALEAGRGKQANKFFTKASDDENIANISNYERTGKFANEPTPGYSDTYKQSTEHAYQLNQQTYGKNELGHIDNYVRRNWTFGSEAEAQKATDALYNYSRSLKPADTGNLKQRTLTMPLDEAQQVLADRGIKAKLISTNPEVLRQQAVASATRAAGYKELGDYLKGTGQIRFVRLGGQVPEGYVKLGDRAFQVYFPSEAGMVKAGEYYANEGAARILNNAVSKGLEGSAVFRGLRNVKNNINLVNLGLSGFHAGTTTLNASVNDLAQGMRSLIGGHPVRGVGEILRGVTPGVSVVRDYLQGKNFKEFAKTNPEAAQATMDALNTSGFRLSTENRYKTTVGENMMQAFRNNNPLGGIARAPMAAIEVSTKPIMEKLVPNVKLGTMLDRIKSIQERMPNASDGEIAKALAKASDSMDNIYGQMVYDNVFWNKTFKDLAMLSQRSVGWNLGTVRELGGGFTDILSRTARGKGVSDKTLFTAALPLLVGLYGATYEYLHTGKPPTSLTDYFFPKTGLTDKNGNPDRVSLPSYMKDVFAYGKNAPATIGHKLSPELGMVLDLFNNHNYVGDLIRNPNDPIAKQLEHVAGYLAKQGGQPFSVQQFFKQKASGGSAEQQAEAFGGITPAPGTITKTGVEQQVQAALNQATGTKPLTPEEQAIRDLKSQAKQGVQQGDTTKINQLLQSKQITPKQAQNIRDAAARTSLQNSFNLLLSRDRPTAAKIIQSANPSDLQKIGNLDTIKQQMAYDVTHQTANTTPQSLQAAKDILKKLGVTTDAEVRQLSQQKKVNTKQQQFQNRRTLPFFRKPTANLLQ